MVSVDVKHHVYLLLINLLRPSRALRDDLISSLTFNPSQWSVIPGDFLLKKIIKSQLSTSVTDCSWNMSIYKKQTKQKQTKNRLISCLFSCKTTVFFTQKKNPFDSNALSAQNGTFVSASTDPITPWIASVTGFDLLRLMELWSCTASKRRSFARQQLEWWTMF